MLRVRKFFGTISVYHWNSKLIRINDSSLYLRYNSTADIAEKRSSTVYCSDSNTIWLFQVRPLTSYASIFWLQNGDINQFQDCIAAQNWPLHGKTITNLKTWLCCLFVQISIFHYTYQTCFSNVSFSKWSINWFTKCE